METHKMTQQNPVHVRVETPHVVAAGISDTGLVRPGNEDSIWIDDSGLVLAVADGMGGHERGEEASQTAIKVFQERLNRETIQKELKDVTEEWINAGRIGEEPAKNIITRVIGVNPGVEADIEWDKRLKDDVYLLCSDGLTDMITDEQIQEILQDGNHVDDMTKRLVDAALAAGGRDNVSVVVCKVL